ncbi:unnamed protein product [Nyctereutes procyonoides]|uniref:(raccoon dog) hypothetical protein n=1 Tax=Nyctereutes procyonoides TaxID=34880 RepID=A0A811ZS82_NYCPR|nr:unnamed protein product [Nyctereutes procyonoides]
MASVWGHACMNSALTLQDDEVPVMEDKINVLMKAVAPANVNIGRPICNVGAGAGGPAPSVTAAPAEEKQVKAKKEESGESDDDMGFDLSFLFFFFFWL